MLYYAQLDENNICIALSEVPTPLYGDNIVPRKFGDEAALGKRYNNGIWEKTELSDPTPEPSNSELLMAIQKSQEELTSSAIDEYTMELIESGII